MYTEPTTTYNLRVGPKIPLPPLLPLFGLQAAMEEGPKTPAHSTSTILPPTFAAILKEKFVCSLATVDSEGLPWACNCYFVFVEENGPRLVFASAPHTRHVENFLLQPIVAATVAHASPEPSAIRGLQLLGRVDRLEETHSKARLAYFERFPYARNVAEVELWNFSIQFAKLTDNRISFGYKETWERAQ